MNSIDVAIIGGGPIGGYVAKNIASAGLKATIFEEHQTVGKPLKCAGLVSSRVLEFCKHSKNSVIQNKIYGARIHSPAGHVLTIGGNRVHAFVIDRPQFDKEIINSALDEGAGLSLQSKIIDAKRIKNQIQIRTTHKRKNRDIKSKLVIGADGAHSQIRKIFNFPQPTEYLKGFGAEVTNTILNPKFVEIFLGQKIAPGFFAWVIPLNSEGSHARIGLCINKQSKYSLKQCFTFLMKTKPLQQAEPSKYIGGTIPFNPLKKTTDSNIMLVGDAAAQVKPTSGGGLYPGLTCARLCSSVAIQAFEQEKFNNQFLKKYHKYWTSEIGKELSLGMKFRSIFKRLNDDQLEIIIDKLDTNRIRDIIRSYGDIDYPSKLAIPVLKAAPSLLSFLPTMIKRQSHNII